MSDKYAIFIESDSKIWYEEHFENFTIGDLRRMLSSILISGYNPPNQREHMIYPEHISEIRIKKLT